MIEHMKNPFPHKKLVIEEKARSQDMVEYVVETQLFGWFGKLKTSSSESVYRDIRNGVIRLNSRDNDWFTEYSCHREDGSLVEDTSLLMELSNVIQTNHNNTVLKNQAASALIKINEFKNKKLSNLRLENVLLRIISITESPSDEKQNFNKNLKEAQMALALVGTPWKDRKSPRNPPKPKYKKKSNIVQ